MSARGVLVALIWLAGLGCIALPARAAEPDRIPALQAAAGKRVALVIGNAAYPGAPLSNPVNDARDIALALRRLGFEVIERTNVTQKDMNRAIAQFGERLRADSVALFYYAGHGLQVRGKNYLIPIDAQIQSEASVRAEAVDVDTVMDQLTASPLNIVILDACRNNPFERRFRSMGGGLAQMDAPKGSLIAYATAPGKVAADGTGRNGLYTQELLKQIQTPGLTVEAVFKRVRNGVMAASGEAQTPWESSSLTGDFYFRAPEAGQPSEAALPAPAGEPPATADRPASAALSVELAFWQAAKESNDPAQLRAYLERYPDGEFASLAKLRLAGAQAAVPRPVEPLITALPASAFKASSTWFNDTDGHGPANARYSSTETWSNWSAGTNDTNQWLQIDLQRTCVVTAIGTMGRFNPCPLGLCPQWVKSYRLAYSTDGVSWKYLEENGAQKLFAGNSDRLTEVRNPLVPPIQARFLRIYPQDWNTHITMRAEAYGYPAEPR